MNCAIRVVAVIALVVAGVCRSSLADRHEDPNLGWSFEKPPRFVNMDPYLVAQVESLSRQSYTRQSSAELLSGFISKNARENIELPCVFAQIVRGPTSNYSREEFKSEFDALSTAKLRSMLSNPKDDNLKGIKLESKTCNPATGSYEVVVELPSTKYGLVRGHTFGRVTKDGLVQVNIYFNPKKEPMWLRDVGESMKVNTGYEWTPESSKAKGMLGSLIKSAGEVTGQQDANGQGSTSQGSSSPVSSSPYAQGTNQGSSGSSGSSGYSAGYRWGRRTGVAAVIVVIGVVLRFVWARL